jgi:ribosomal 30S subunit maturation factor RimM
VLEVGDEGTLVPLVSDAIERVDVEAGEIHVRREFLG